MSSNNAASCLRSLTVVDQHTTLFVRNDKKYFEFLNRIKVKFLSVYISFGCSSYLENILKSKLPGKYPSIFNMNWFRRYTLDLQMENDV